MESTSGNLYNIVHFNGIVDIEYAVECAQFCWMLCHLKFPPFFR